MSTPGIHNTVIKQLKLHQRVDTVHHLDIGAGTGEFIGRLRRHINVITRACDYTDSLMELPGQKVDVVNLNQSALPYESESFDVVTATEVIEHLENFRGLLREIYRVLKPGGFCVLSTPNILNINSRLRFLWFGFAQLFGPLRIGARNVESCAGHISPISWFYLCHGLRETGFTNVSFDVDKYQRSGTAKAILLWLPIKAVGHFLRKKESSKFHTIDESNQEIVGKLNSLPMLLGRTVLVTASKE